MPNQKIEKWLDEVCAKILRPSYRKRVRKELKEHLNDRIRQLENDGMTHEQATEQAICLMGDTKKLIEAFAKCDHSFLSIEKSLSTFFIWFMIALLLVYLISRII